MKRRVFGFLALALGIVLAACSGGTDYVGVSESSTTPAVVENYSITYNLNGGTNAASNPDNYNVESTVTLADATREGYAFGGWYGTANFSGSAITVIAAGSTGNKTLYAKWTGGTASGGGITVTFDNETDIALVNSGSTYTVPNDYTVVEWTVNGKNLSTETVSGFALSNSSKTLTVTESSLAAGCYAVYLEATKDGATYTAVFQVNKNN